MGVIESMLKKAKDFLSSRINLETTAITALLLLVNLPLVSGGVSSSLIYDPAAVSAGQYYRVFTHPFVHLGWYHLALDGGAFVLLWRTLTDMSTGKRIAAALFCCTGALALTLLTSPAVGLIGLCGLSGTAHGLMAVSALDSAFSEDDKMRRVGGWVFLLLAAKTVWELLSGRVLFDFLHFGYVGTPLTACHGGGVLAGALFALALNAKNKHYSTRAFISS